MIDINSNKSKNNDMMIIKRIIIRITHIIITIIIRETNYNNSYSFEKKECLYIWRPDAINRIHINRPSRAMTSDPKSDQVEQHQEEKEELQKKKKRKEKKKKKKNRTIFFLRKKIWGV